MAQERFLLVLDEGTTSTRAMLFNLDGTVAATAQAELTQYYPADGYVEHDAAEIWDRTLGCARKMVKKAGGADRIAAIGITNQRETVVAWDKRSGQPVCRAIVWQDRRTAEACDRLRAEGFEMLIRQRTGLELDPYFSGTKMRWILENVPEAAGLGSGLAFGTVESWLVWKLTGGLHISDATNASRTMLMPLDGPSWDPELLDLLGVPVGALPEIVDSAGNFGATLPELFGAPIPICGLAGDQQAATIGQNCLLPGQVKATLGTGAFVLASTGHELPRSENRLLGTVLAQCNGKRIYALEGSVFVAGSLVKWLRDQIGLISTATESEDLARSVPDNAGVCIIPALAGLGAPHWRPDARGLISGLTQGTTRAHIVRAALESMAHQMNDLKRAYAADSSPWAMLRLDGGMSANDWISQDLADILDIPVERPANVETTALGAAMLASVGYGLDESLEAAGRMRGHSASFHSTMDGTTRQKRLNLWRTCLSLELDRG